jgi:hypothetical protein
VHEAELDLAEPLAPEVGRQVRGPQPALRTCSCSGAISLRNEASSSSAKIVSIGQISSRTKSRIQSSFCWNSGSVEKSHAMASPVELVADPV